MTAPAPQTAKSAQKAETRARILKEAGEAIRTQGADRVTVAEVMGRAGLTVGGFYAHFASKDDLLMHAVGHMFDERYASFLADQPAADPQAALARFVDNYLSMRHRDAVGRGCPVPALSSEIGRLAPPVRAAFLRGMERLSEALARLLAQAGHADPEATALSAIAEMTGAMGMARAQPDPVKAEALLAGSRAAIRARLGIGRPAG